MAPNAPNKQITPSHPVQHGPGAIQPMSAPLAHANNSGETAALAMATKQKALVEARFTLAQHRPRDLDVVRGRLMKECARPSFARSALYLKPIGEGVEGPSIRFVEAAITAMQNIYSDVSTVHDDPEKRVVHVEVTDAEANVSHGADVTIQKTVERNSVRDGDEVVRTRTGKYGKTVYVKRATDDEILNTVNALTSKALRTCGLRLIPGWLTSECLDAIHATLQNADAADPDAAKRRLFDSFSAIGVSPERVKEWLGHDGASLQPAERTALGGIYNAIKDGETTWQEVMDARVPAAKDAQGTTKQPALPAAQNAKGAAGVKARVAAAVAGQKAATAPAPDDVPGWPAGGPPEPTDDREPGEDG
jgi:hypothetical protein